MGDHVAPWVVEVRRTMAFWAASDWDCLASANAMRVFLEVLMRLGIRNVWKGAVGDWKTVMGALRRNARVAVSIGFSFT